MSKPNQRIGFDRLEQFLTESMELAKVTNRSKKTSFAQLSFLNDDASSFQRSMKATSENDAFQAAQQIVKTPEGEEVIAVLIATEIELDGGPALTFSLHVKGEEATRFRIALGFKRKRFPRSQIRFEPEMIKLPKTNNQLFDPAESQPQTEPSRSISAKSLERTQKWEDLAAQLDDLGLWRDLSEQRRRENIAAVSAGTHPWSTEMAETVWFPADGEALAESGVEEYLEELAPTLALHGVTLNVSTLRDSLEEGYAVLINSIEAEIHRGEVSFAEPETEEDFAWYSATVQPLAVLNHLLKEAGAIVRFHTLYTGGNDGCALLIDPAIPTAMRAAGKLARGETPFLPTLRKLDVF
jgi:hypothetical protein